MTPERVQSLLTQNRIPQHVLSTVSGVSTFTISMWLRGSVGLSDEQARSLEIALAALVEVCDSSPFPLDWRQFSRFRSTVNEKVTQLRRERSAALRRAFEAGQIAVA